MTMLRHCKGEASTKWCSDEKTDKTSGVISKFKHKDADNKGKDDNGEAPIPQRRTAEAVAGSKHFKRRRRK